MNEAILTDRSNLVQVSGIDAVSSIKLGRVVIVMRKTHFGFSVNVCKTIVELMASTVNMAGAGIAKRYIIAVSDKSVK